MTVWTHVGNVQNWDITPNPTIIKHKNTQGGLKRVDLVAMTLVEMAFSCKLDEWTPDNIKMALLGSSSASTAGQIITIGTSIVQRQMKFTGGQPVRPAVGSHPAQRVHQRQGYSCRSSAATNSHPSRFPAISSTTL